MKSSGSRVKEPQSDWLIEAREKLSQECNHLTERERREARRRALHITYGTDTWTE